MSWLVDLLGPPVGRDQYHFCADGKTHLEGHRGSGVGLALEPIVQPTGIEVETKRGVAEHFVEVPHGEVVVADVAYRRSRRSEDIEAGIFAELADAEEMGAVGDDDDMVEVVFVGDGG